MSLRIARSLKKPGVVVLTLAGSLDAKTATDLEDEVGKLLQDSDIIGLVLDLELLEFISSAGLRVVVMAQKGMKAAGGTLMMINLQPQIRKVFDIVKALPSMEVFSSVTELDNYLAQMQRCYCREQ